MLVYVVRDGQLLRTPYPHPIRQGADYSLAHSPKIGLCGRDKALVVDRYQRFARRQEEFYREISEEFQKSHSTALSKLNRIMVMDTTGDIPVRAVENDTDKNY